MKKIWKVDIIESERGYGQKVDETLWFETEDLAQLFYEQYNSRNTESTVPDLYWRADYPYGIQYPDEKDIITTREGVLERVPDSPITVMDSSSYKRTDSRGSTGMPWRAA